MGESPLSKSSCGISPREVERQSEELSPALAISGVGGVARSYWRALTRPNEVVYLLRGRRQAGAKLEGGHARSCFGEPTALIGIF